MKPKKRQKLCHNCEGEIDLDVIVCPFCAADLREEKPEQGRPSYHAMTQTFAREEQASQSLYPASLAPKPVEEETLYEEPALQTEALHPPEEKSKNVFLATILFTLGVQLVLLGLLMLLFSHKGMVVLRWNVAHWFLYCLGGCPFLYFGYHALSKL